LRPNAAAADSGPAKEIAVSKPTVFPAPGSKADSEEGTVFAPRFDAHGLLPVVATSAATGEVLMLAYMNEEALARTIATGEAHYWSRSRERLWRKGDESGSVQRVVELRTDCDQDAIWLKVETAGTGAACHTGRKSCFYRVVPLGAEPRGALSLRFVDAERQFDPDSVYRHAGAAKGTLKSSE
jgi:phosphoribosyl-AMP cyclohydrolase